MSRKLDLSQFQGDDDDDFLPRSKTLALTDLKSRTFNHGITKKSKKDLEREAEERKIKEEEEAQAKLLADFENSFDGPGAGPSAGYGGRGMGGGFVRAGGGGAPIAPRSFAPPSGPAQPPRGPAALGYARPHRPQTRAPSPPPSGPKPKGKRAMDSFLEEIKGNQAARDSRLGTAAKGSSVSALAAWEHSSGSRHANEQESTNLFVGNLPATITEDVLGRFFAEIGPVGTVKIMWPRSEMEMEAASRGKMSLTGFVAYMKRRDAETAVQELDGVEWGSSKLKVGFSKWVPVPSKPLYDLTSGRKRSRSRSPTRSRMRSISREPSRSPGRQGRESHRETRSPKRRRRSLSSSTYSRSPSPRRGSEKDEARRKWLDKVPEERAKLIRAVVDKVKDKGRGFEDLMMDREKDNPTFSFFFDKKLPDYHLYRMLLSSRYRVPTPPPEDFDDNGYASIYSSDSAEDSEKEDTAKAEVGRLGKKRFSAMLRKMSGKRAEIARAMEFALKRPEAAEEVAEIICQSLQLDDTPVPRKLARLHLVSDILHNSASPLPNVWKYRLAFEKRLPVVFAHFKNVYDSLHAYTGNISADVFKTQVATVLDVWERWIVFSQDVHDSLRDYLSGKRKPGQPAETDSQTKQTAADQRENSAAKEKERSGFKTSGFKSSFKPISAAPTIPIKLDADLDGEAIVEDVDGEPIDDVDGEPISDVDGEPIADDTDGEPMDEDLDGEAL